MRYFGRTRVTALAVCAAAAAACCILCEVGQSKFWQLVLLIACVAIGQTIVPRVHGERLVLWSVFASVIATVAIFGAVGFIATVRGGSGEQVPKWGTSWEAGVAVGLLAGGAYGLLGGTAGFIAGLVRASLLAQTDGGNGEAHER